MRTVRHSEAIHVRSRISNTVNVSRHSSGKIDRDRDRHRESHPILQVNFISNFFLFLFYLFYFLTLKYCIVFAIYQHESTTGIPVFPILNPPPSSLPIASLWVVPVHQPQASSIMHRTWTGDSFHIRYYTCFNAILPNHPTLSLSHRVKKNTNTVY